MQHLCSSSSSSSIVYLLVECSDALYSLLLLLPRQAPPCSPPHTPGSECTALCIWPVWGVAVRAGRQVATCPIVKALVLMRCKHVIQGESAWLQAIAAAAAATAALRFAVITATVTFTVMAEVAAVTAAVTAATAATAGAAAMIAQPLLCHH
jgi:hypothetical protein